MPCACSSASCCRGERPTVVVVGAGVSGLACAKYLSDQPNRNYDVVVLEANDYVGGRIRQVDHPLFPETPLEIGAEFVHGGDTIIHAIGRQEGWTFKQIFTWAQGDQGPTDEPAPDGGVGYYYVGKEKKLLKYDSTDPDFVHMNDTLVTVGDQPADSNDRRTILDFLKDNDVADRMVAMADAGYANTMAANLEDLSLQNCRRIETFWNDGEDGEEDYRVVPTFAPLVNFLAKSETHENHNVLLNSVVAKLDFSGGCANGVGSPVNPVSVHLRDGRELRAAHVVVTASMPVLQDGDIQFAPPLPADKLRAIGEIRSGNALKVLLKFRRRVWPEDLHGMICSDCDIPEFWVRDVGQAMDGHDNPVDVEETDPGYFVVVGFAMGKYAQRLGALAKEEVVENMLCQMDDIFEPTAGPKCAHLACEGGVVFNWADSPHIRTGYTYPSVQEKSNSRRILARPEFNNRLHFAGEASEYNAAYMTIHSSIRTGMRAAEEVLVGLRGAPPSKL